MKNLIVYNIYIYMLFSDKNLLSNRILPNYILFIVTQNDQKN